MNAFVPTGGPTLPANIPVPNDLWYPPLSTADFAAQTGLGHQYPPERLAAELGIAAIDTNSILAIWRSRQTAGSLAAIPAAMYGGTTEKELLYKRAVHALARARLTSVVRDYDTTGKGDKRADVLDRTVEGWYQSAQEALARLTERPSAVTVDLI